MRGIGGSELHLHNESGIQYQIEMIYYILSQV